MDGLYQYKISGFFFVKNGNRSWCEPTRLESFRKDWDYVSYSELADGDAPLTPLEFIEWSD